MILVGLPPGDADENQSIQIHEYYNVANLCRGKTRQDTPDVASYSLRKVEAYLTVRGILPETIKGADGVAWRKFGGFGRQQVCNVRVNAAPNNGLET
jgi:hypothetical protein